MTVQNKSKFWVRMQYIVKKNPSWLFLLTTYVSLIEIGVQDDNCMCSNWYPRHGQLSFFDMSSEHHFKVAYHFTGLTSRPVKLVDQ